MISARKRVDLGWDLQGNDKFCSGICGKGVDLQRELLENSGFCSGICKKKGWIWSGTFKKTIDFAAGSAEKGRFGVGHSRKLYSLQRDLWKRVDCAAGSVKKSGGSDVERSIDGD